MVDLLDVELPAGVSVAKRALGGGWAYHFRDVKLGELGRIRVTDRGDGTSELVCETAGDPLDPMTARRAALFEPLGRAVAGRMAGIVPAGAPGLPSRPYDEPRGMVENRMVLCPRCRAIVARLVCAPDAVDPGRFEDMARMLFPSFAEWPVPTWIIGPDADDGGDPDLRPSDVMRVLPSRRPVERLSPAELNRQLAELQASHCRGG